MILIYFICNTDDLPHMPENVLLYIYIQTNRNVNMYKLYENNFYTDFSYVLRLYYVYGIFMEYKVAVLVRAAVCVCVCVHACLCL